MTYTPQTWDDTPSTSTPIDATRLAYMEAGIAAASSAATLSALLGWTDVRSYGGIADWLSSTGSMSSSSNTTKLTITGALFSSGDIGKSITVFGAGAAGANLTTTIATWTSATVVTLSAACQTTVSGATVHWGTDNGVAFQAAHDSISANAGTTGAQGANGGTIYAPPGRYGIWTAVNFTNSGIALHGGGSIQHSNEDTTGTLTRYGGGTVLITDQPITLLTCGNGTNGELAGARIRWINFQDKSGAKVATLLRFYAQSRSRVECCSFSNAAVGIETDGNGLDSSWHVFAFNSFAYCTKGIYTINSLGAGSNVGGSYRVQGGDFIVGTSGIGIHQASTGGNIQVDGVKMDLMGTGGVGFQWDEGQYGTVSFSLEAHNTSNIAINITSITSPGLTLANCHLFYQAPATGTAIQIRGTTTGINIIGGHINSADIGIDFGSGIDASTVMGVQFCNSTTEDVLFASGSKYNTLLACNGFGGSKLAVTDNDGSNTVYLGGATSGKNSPVNA